MLSNPNPTHPVEANANAAKLAFLAEMAKHWNVWRAAKKLGIERKLVYNDWLVKDSEFKERYDDILAKHIDGAEGNLMHQATHNKKNYVPAIFMLKAHRPQVYDRQQDINVNHNLMIDLTGTASRLLDRAKQAIEADVEVLNTKVLDKVDAQNEA